MSYEERALAFRCGDAALVDDLTQLSGSPPTAGMLLRARALFAHALETPGGLRIQTIHAFCEAVLHRFPQEAGVPFDFTVLEEHERDSMLLEAREAVLATGLRGGAHAGAVETLFEEITHFSDTYDSALMIGHNPGIHELSRMMSEHGSSYDLGRLAGSFLPSMLAVIECRTERWSEIAPRGNTLSHLLSPI